jgi:hypothetical protein
MKNKNISKLLKKLTQLGYEVKISDGSCAKVYHPDKTKPFYSLHIGDKGILPLRCFAKKHWGLDILSI